MTAKTTKTAKKQDNRVGLAPSKRPTTPAKANQWNATPQQKLFMELWTNPKSDTFGNAYGSALQAGYSAKYAANISIPSVANKWIREYNEGTEFTDKHIKNGIQAIALNPSQAKSPDDTRLKAYELLAKIQGMTNPKANVTNNIVVTPILNGMSVNAKDTKASKGTENTDVIDV